MKKITILLLLLLLVSFTFSLQAQSFRDEIKIPDILGYQTLKCDFHMHTVFSDGLVWPTVRVQEAWRQGLDAIAITDHLEYLPHKDDVNPDQNRSFELAKPLADRLGIILIRGTEITRSMPPGHFNAIFIKDAPKINKKNWRDAIMEANRQGAFVFWNHPGWKAQAPDGAKWYPEHTDLYENNLFQGIEIVNQKSYYPVVFKWAIEKNLTIFGNSDSHNPIDYEFDPAEGKHRPLTLVFASERTEKGIYDALKNNRTAVFYEDKIFGKEEFLKEIFLKSVDVLTPKLKIIGKNRADVLIRNNSDLIFKLSAGESDLALPENVTLFPGKVTSFSIKAGSKVAGNQKMTGLNFRVDNFFIGADSKLSVEVPLKIEIVPEGE